MRAVHVAITGASSGIGEALVREFAKSGARITLVARRREAMERIAKSVAAETHIAAVDLSRRELALSWIDEAEAKLGPIDVLINNAGVMLVESSATIDAQAAEQEMELDLMTPLALIGAFVRKMLARGGGTIVNVASVAGLAPAPGMMHYNASKAGLAAASESLRGELRGTGVNVLTVYPGITDTALAQGNIVAYPKSRIVALMPVASTESLAKEILRAIEKKRARLIYPRVYTMTRHFPGFMRWFLNRFAPLPKPPALREASS